ncbi:MAG: ATP-grasp domain-containing protein [Cyclobacteriaceae bacterium]
MAKNENVNFVLAYASDPAAIIASQVSEKLNLPGNSKESVFQLTDKGAFRDLLENLNLPVPNRIVLDEREVKERENFSLNYPLIVKPIDSSGSKGVSKITAFDQFNEAVQNALKFSRSKKVIVEEYLDNTYGDVHGDGFVVDGKLVFCHLGDHIYGSKSNEFNPTGTMWPAQVSKETIDSFTADVQKVITACGFINGPINIEARVNHLGEKFIMEIGPRNGGHFVPQAIQHATGFDMVGAIFDLMEGKKVIISEKKNFPVAYHAIHSSGCGILDSITIDAELKRRLVFQKLYKKKGDEILPFTGSNAALGILLFKFESVEEMVDKMSKIQELVKIIFYHE